MPSYSRIIVGSDGSQSARDATAVAGVLAAKIGAPVTAVTAWKPQIEVPGVRELDWAERMTTGADIDLNSVGATDVTKVEVKGDPADALLEVAAAVQDALIVVGASGLEKATSRLAGSTANTLSHKSSVDVLFVRRRVEEIGTVALATDGSVTSLIAVRHGYDLATRLGATVSLVTVAESVEAGEKLLRAVEEDLGFDGAIELQALTGNAAEALMLLYPSSRGRDGCGLLAEWPHERPYFAGEEPFEASDDLGFRLALGGSTGNVGLGWLVVLHSDDHRPV